MALDHSLTYTQWRLRNVAHILRLRAIRRRIEDIKARLATPAAAYADFGCSNGFITAQVADILRPRAAWGFDHSQDNLRIGRQKHPGIEFRPVDLNADAGLARRFDVVTCFETLEHVGSVDAAVRNVVGALKPGGLALIVVPIEHGPVGLLKYLVKVAYGYNLRELSADAVLWPRYLAAMLTNRRMSGFRDAARASWGTHFGFDYRDVDEALQAMGCRYRAYRGGFNRFYEVRAAG